MRILTVCLLPLTLAACSIRTSPEAVGTSASAASTAPISGLVILPTDVNMSF